MMGEMEKFSYFFKKSSNFGQGRFIKRADPSACPMRGTFFEGRLVIRTRRQAIRQTLASVLREGTQRPSLGGGGFPVSLLRKLCRIKKWS